MSGLSMVKSLSKGVAKAASPFFEEGLQKAVTQGVDPKALKNMPLGQLEEVVGNAQNLSRQQRINTQLDKIVNPVDTTTGLKQQLETFINTNKQSLEAAPTGKMQTVEGEVDAKLFPGTPEELLEKASEYIRLREGLHEAGEKGYAQSRAGWESIFGHVLDKDGYPMRLSGGTRNSKEGKKLTLKSQRSSIDREAGLRSFKGDFKGEARNRQWKELELQGHHWETAAKEADIWSAKELPNGRIGRRSQEDIDYIEEGLRKRGITGIGDKPENLTGLGQPAHIGAGLEETKPLAAHETAKRAYDFEGFRDWQKEATEIYVKLPPISGRGKNPRFVWYKNVDGKLYTKRGNTPVKLPEGSEKLAFRMEGTRGTFSAKQKHGFTQEYAQNIRREEDPDKVIEAIATYYEAGIPEKRRGTSTVARRFLQKSPADPQSEKMFFGAAADEEGVMADLMKLPEYQQIPEFRQKIAELQEIMKETRR